MTKKVLIIGGHGKVAQLSTPRLVSAGLDVTSLIRSPEQVPDIEALGSTPLVRDLSVLDTDDWAQLLGEFDVVVWSAGSGGHGGATATYAIDRDGALCCIGALEKLKDETSQQPKLIMVSYLGSLDHGIDPEDPFFPYADSKKTVDQRLLDSELDFLILAPARLTMDPANGIEVISGALPGDGAVETSRELVAMVIAEMATRDSFPERDILPFIDGTGGVEAAKHGVEKL
ncbi:NAD(P)-binding oxidoreductase [Corynebacterium alimapuense]|uniref:Nucleoside-diphosphate sugar epimerase n=1 Tax=Corynebacterium alimapuense TaxID=1576874 RepID=A0A3M8K9I0_9CORY|nr:NAD(P)-binding oxidoreductase [Corynebacterium alimapuense]RNE49174.1 nucleoside-diphosphate sugar epimerase [Corynebacterium alimapuense]